MDGTIQKPKDVDPIKEARERRIVEEAATAKRDDIREKIEALLEHGQYTIALFKHTRIPDEKTITTELTLVIEETEWDTCPTMFRMLQRKLSEIRQKEQAERAGVGPPPPGYVTPTPKPIPEDEDLNGQPKPVE